MQNSLSPLLKNTSLQDLKGLGKKLEETLAKLNIFNIQDLLFHFPFRYEDRTRTTDIARLQAAQLVVIDAEVVVASIEFGKRRSLSVQVKDETGICHIRFFHFNQSQKKQFSEGRRVRIIGEARRGAKGVEIYHPEYQFFLDEPPPLDHSLTPIYSICEGLSSKRISALIDQALQLLDACPRPLLLPELSSVNSSEMRIPVAGKLPATYNELLRVIHRPQFLDDASLLVEANHPYQRLLAFEELLAHSLSAKKRRKTKINNEPTYILNRNVEVHNNFLDSLSFELTTAQQRVINEIFVDMTQEGPMRRLVQGDVGCGKTLVAASVALQVIQQGKQVVLMAPTEILAEQHAQNFEHWFKPFGIKVALLLGKHSGKLRQDKLDNIASRNYGLVIGTHALFQPDVIFNELALVIIDEQHRFGVHQRLALQQKAKGPIPHQLIMTATPIPRSLAMTMYGDLDCSIIDELPPGRTPVKTVLIDNGRRKEVIERVRSACQESAQAYWVCTLIEESDNLQAKAAEELLSELQSALPELSLDLIHGRLRPEEKMVVIDKFKKRKTDLLVATTVIEVGVDIPNSSVMIIENPERLGLAQLHQLRGRVGRGAKASFCVLLYESPLGNIAKQRLSVMRDSNDGFVIAEKDLTIRGPGEVMGTRQAGAAMFKIADLIRDADLIEDAALWADRVSETEQTLSNILIDRWLGTSEHYASVG